MGILLFYGQVLTIGTPLVICEGEDKTREVHTQHNIVEVIMEPQGGEL